MNNCKSMSIKKITIIRLALFVLVTHVFCQNGFSQAVYSFGEYSIDNNLKLIICNRPPSAITSHAGSVTFDKIYYFDTAVTSLQIGIAYPVKSVTGDNNNYNLYFTKIPIVNIQVPSNINAETEESGFIHVSDTVGTAEQWDMGIKIRGASSAYFPKKSYRVQIKNAAGDYKDLSFLGLREDKRWLLLAMWNETLRLNNTVSTELWAQIHKLYYAASEPDAQASVRMKYVEVFINNAYQGIYAFAEDMDRKQLKLKKQQGNIIKGELYKGDSWGDANTFDELPDLPISDSAYWGGWEVRYPDTTRWTNLYNFTNFVINTTPANFASGIFQRIDRKSTMDYFIFLNLIRGFDNSGKNMFLARYNTNEPYFFAPWDLDATWGYYYNFSKDTATTGVLDNGLFRRLLNLNPYDYRNDLADRWFALRTNVLAIDSVKKYFISKYDFLKNNGVYERENKLWTAGSLPTFEPSELTYFLNWSEARIHWLDNYFFRMKTILLPVELVDFDGRIAGGKTKLTWTTNSESNNASFEIERSATGTNFKSLASVASKSVNGNSNIVLHYLMNDARPFQNKNYYRIKQWDKDGNFYYSKTIELENSNKQISIYPNPVEDYLNVNMASGSQQTYTAAIIDFTGKKLRSYKFINNSRFDIHPLVSGIYLLIIWNEKGEIVKKEKIIKL